MPLGCFVVTSGAAKGPGAPAETNPGHVSEMRPAPGEGGAVQENQGHGGEVRGSWGSRRAAPEEAFREEGQDDQLGKLSHLHDRIIHSCSLP